MTRRLRCLASGACALLAMALCLVYGEQVRSECAQEREEALERFGGEVVTLVVAREAIEAGETIGTENARELAWVAELAPPGAVTSMDSVIGAKLSVPVAAGVPITELNLRSETDVAEVPAGKVALTVPADEDLGVPPGVGIGAQLAAFEVSDRGVRLLSDDITVLGVPAGTGGAFSSGQLSMAVMPEDVASLLAASGEGTLRLAMPGDETEGLAEAIPSAPSSVPSQETSDVGERSVEDAREGLSEELDSAEGQAEGGGEP